MSTNSSPSSPESSQLPATAAEVPAPDAAAVATATAVTPSGSSATLLSEDAPTTTPRLPQHNPKSDADLFIDPETRSLVRVPSPLVQSNPAEPGKVGVLCRAHHGMPEVAADTHLSLGPGLPDDGEACGGEQGCIYAHTSLVTMADRLRYAASHTCYLYASEDDVAYVRFLDGDHLPQHEEATVLVLDDVEMEYERVRTSRIIATIGADRLRGWDSLDRDTRQPFVSCCETYRHELECTKGASCQFIHIVEVDPDRAATPPEKGRRGTISIAGRARQLMAAAGIPSLAPKTPQARVSPPPSDWLDFAKHDMDRGGHLRTPVPAHAKEESSLSAEAAPWAPPPMPGAGKKKKQRGGKHSPQPGPGAQHQAYAQFGLTAPPTVPYAMPVASTAATPAVPTVPLSVVQAVQQQAAMQVSPAAIPQMPQQAQAKRPVVVDAIPIYPSAQLQQQQQQQVQQLRPVVQPTAPTVMPLMQFAAPAPQPPQQYVVLQPQQQQLPPPQVNPRPYVYLRPS